MIWIKKLGALLSLVTMALLISTCGSKSKSDQVNVYVIPNQPVVITADYNDGNGNTWKAPWFSFHLEIQNNSNDYVTIMAIQVAVTATTSTGTVLTPTVVQISPSNSNMSITCGTNSVTLSYISFGTVAPGSTAYAQLIYNNSGTGTPIATLCPGLNPNIANPTIFVANNPGASQQVTSYNYQVAISPIGWFGQLNSPNDRFTKTITISTQ